jgi:exopolysaccharide biosynthesis protein
LKRTPVTKVTIRCHATRNALTPAPRRKGTRIAIARRVTPLIRLTLILSLAASLAASAQTYGSKYRQEYEGEKNGPHGECRVDWTRAADGLDYRTITCLGGSEPDMHVVRIDPKRYRLDSAVAPRGHASTVARANAAVFSINANFFDAAGRAEGVVASGGEIVQSPANKSWQSIFLVTSDDKPRIIAVDQWPSYRKRARMAVQAGPRLVVAGHTNKVHQSYAAARAGVCIQKDGTLLFFATPQERKLDMYEIGRVTRRAAVDGGLECRDAMLFDGGHSTQLHLDGTRISVSGDPVPVFVYAVPR